jgi:2-amino-4-hydroxy-6-hydroxymethyldihydropteridine diphosphokinase
MRAYIGMGANLGNREETIKRALALLAGRPGVNVVAVSSLRETDPVGFAEQPRFLNGAAAVDGPRFGPRTIDLDLLVYGGREVAEPGLTVPHPRLAERAFALEPLAELDPELEIPGRGRVEDLLRGLQSS